MPLPPLTETGDLPVGVHCATLSEVLARFGVGAAQRRRVGRRLRRVHELATATGLVARFIVFGSFVTDRADPGDVDVFLLMDDAFDLASAPVECRSLLTHPAAQAWFGASVFWLRRMAALGGDEAAVEGWQSKRDGSRRGIVEIVEEA